MDTDNLDAQRYRFLKSLRGLEIFRDSTQWTREDGSKFSGSIVLRGNDTQFGPGESMDSVIDDARARCEFSSLERRLLLKARVMEIGEKIPWGSDTSLMREAAAALGKLNALANEFDEMHTAVDSRYVCERISFILNGEM